MKICLLTHTYPRFPNDTTAPFVESTAETLQKHGVDVTVTCLQTPKNAKNLDALDENEFLTINIPFESPADLDSQLREVLARA